MDLTFRVQLKLLIGKLKLLSKKIKISPSFLRNNLDLLK